MTSEDKFYRGRLRERLIVEAFKVLLADTLCSEIDESLDDSVDAVSEASIAYVDALMEKAFPVKES